MQSQQILPLDGNERDIVETMLFLCSDRARFVTGETLRVTAGFALCIEAGRRSRCTHECPRGGWAFQGIGQWSASRDESPEKKCMRVVMLEDRDHIGAYRNACFGRVYEIADETNVVGGRQFDQYDHVGDG